MTPGDSTVYVGPGLGHQCSENNRPLSDAKVGSCSPLLLVYLHHISRSGKGKLTKNSNEAEYRIILDNLISDLLVVLYWPEWPAASLILSVICKFMVWLFGHSWSCDLAGFPLQVASLDDVKTSVQTDSNAAKAIALDHLGVIAARLRSSTIKVRHRSGKNPLVPLDEVQVPYLEIIGLTARFLRFCQWKICRLSKRS